MENPQGFGSLAPCSEAEKPMTPCRNVFVDLDTDQQAAERRVDPLQLTTLSNLHLGGSIPLVKASKRTSTLRLRTARCCVRLLTQQVFRCGSSEMFMCFSCVTRHVLS